MWREMLGRCTNPRRAAYANYGGRGITVCARWRDSFAAFRDDMGPRPAGATIERVDTNGHYEPGNCRWATSREQARNRRDNVWLTYRGETLCLEDWAARVGLGVTTLHYRVHHGWDLESALTTPPRGRRAA